VTRAQRSFRRLLPAFPEASKSRAAARQVLSAGATPRKAAAAQDAREACVGRFSRLRSRRQCCTALR
jgi:hypothetical protein